MIITMPEPFVRNTLAEYIRRLFSCLRKRDCRKSFSSSHRGENSLGSGNLYPKEARAAHYWDMAGISKAISASVCGDEVKKK